MISGHSARLQELDVLRGLAALTVALSHYFPHWERYVGDVVVLVPNAFGYFAVKLFFVISGFVIFVTLERCRSVLDFAMLRFSRLYPAYWASLAVVTSVDVLVFGSQFWPGGFVTNLTMFQEFLGFPNLDNVYWSLTVELAFYLNVAWVFALGLHRKIHLVLFAWLALAALWIVVSQEVGTVTSFGNEGGRGWSALLFGLDYSPYFVMGVLFFSARRHGWTIHTIALMGMAIAVEFLLAWWEGLAIAAVTGLLFGLALYGRFRVLLVRPMLWLGAVSYSFYLVHRNIGYQMLDWLSEKGLNAYLAIALVVCGVALIATLLAHGVERPASAAMRRWYERRRQRRLPSPSRA